VLYPVEKVHDSISETATRLPPFVKTLGLAGHNTERGSMPLGCGARFLNGSGCAPGNDVSVDLNGKVPEFIDMQPCREKSHSAARLSIVSDDSNVHAADQARLRIIARDVRPLNVTKPEIASVRLVERSVQQDQGTHVSIDGYSLLLSGQVAGYLRTLQQFLDFEVLDCVKQEIDRQIWFVVSLTPHLKKEPPENATIGLIPGKRSATHDSFLWLARHLLMERLFGSTLEPSPRIPSCGVYPCTACDARDNRHSATPKRFRLAQVIRVLPSKLKAFLHLKHRAMQHLENIYASAYTQCSSLQTLPENVLVQIFQHTDSPTILALGQLSSWFRCLTNPIVPELNVELFKHQQAAVLWMLSRERHREHRCGPVAPLLQWKNPLLQHLDGDLYFNWMHRRLERNQSTCYDCRGGLLCDEPGLGKTVTALALIARTRSTIPAIPLFSVDVEYFGSSEIDLAVFICKQTLQFLDQVIDKARARLSRASLDEFTQDVGAVRSRLEEYSDMFHNHINGCCTGQVPELLRFLGNWLQCHEGVLSSIVGSVATKGAIGAYLRLVVQQNPYTAKTCVLPPSEMLYVQPGREKLWFFIVSGKYLQGPSGFLRLASEGIPAASAAGARLCRGASRSTILECAGLCALANEHTGNQGADGTLLMEPSEYAQGPSAAIEPFAMPFRRRCKSRRVPEIECAFDYHLIVCVPTTLVALPENLIPHWTVQIRRLVRAPHELRYCLFSQIRNAVVREIADYDVVFISLNELRSEYSSLVRGLSILNRVYWLRMIIDEGHSLGSLSCTSLQRCCLIVLAERRWIMTGTPTPTTKSGIAEVHHLYPLFSFLGLEPFVWARRAAFQQCVQRPLERALGYEGIHILQQTLDHIMIRSTKEEVQDIPHLEVRDEMLSFTKEEADAYNALVSVVKRNLFLADFFDENHRESLLNPENRKSARVVLQNLRLCCCVTGHMKFEVIREELEELLRTLRQSMQAAKDNTSPSLGFRCGAKRHVPEANQDWWSPCSGDAIADFENGMDRAVSTGSSTLAQSSDCKRRRAQVLMKHDHSAWNALDAAPAAPVRRCLWSLSPSLAAGNLDPELAQTGTQSTAVEALRYPMQAFESTGIETGPFAQRCAQPLPSAESPTEHRGGPPALGDAGADVAAALSPVDYIEDRLRHIERVLRDPVYAQGCICESCGRIGSLMPIVTPCAHIQCLDCAATNRYACNICGRKYLLGRRQEPVDLIEMQPSFTQEAWVPRWDRKMTSKIARMLQLLGEWSSATYTASREGAPCSDQGGNSRQSCVAHGKREKVIIYSNFAHHFDVIHYHLCQGNFDFAYYCSRLSPTERRAQIDRFIYDPHTWILLMDEKGALGLDLSFVTRMIIMEPVWNRSQEHQIISRAHRIGAKQRVIVYRLMMVDSVETDLIDMSSEPTHQNGTARNSDRLSDAGETDSYQYSGVDASPKKSSGISLSNKEKEEKLRRNRLLQRLHFVVAASGRPGTIAFRRVQVFRKGAAPMP